MGLLFDDVMKKMSGSADGHGGVICGSPWYPPPPPPCRQVTKLALDSHITLFDTAEGYGGGTSEIRLGKALEDYHSTSTTTTTTGVLLP